MNYLLRPRIWPSFMASSGVGPCDVPFRYASEPIPRYRGTVDRLQDHLRGLATAIHKISRLDESVLSVKDKNPSNLMPEKNFLSPRWGERHPLLNQVCFSVR